MIEGLGGVESIKHTEVVSIIGRIEKPEDTKKVTYLVRNRAESSLEVSPGSLDSVLWGLQLLISSSTLTGHNQQNRLRFFATGKDEINKSGSDDEVATRWRRRGVGVLE